MHVSSNERNRPLLFLLALAVAACGGSSDNYEGEIFFPGHESEIYADDAHWMCKRGLENDQCDRDLDTAIIQADGTFEIVPHVPLENAKVDCLYFYPTVRLSAEGNAAFDGNYSEEISTTRNQAARFGVVCEVFAPLYRQRTLAASTPEAGAIAYADVVDAFKYYLGNLNNGLPFVLMGHSQGAGLLGSLIAQEIDPNPALRERMVSALLLGSNVQVPVGENVGGSFENIPGCQSDTQTGCVITYASFRDTVPPPDNSGFGRARGEGQQALCTNPANLAGGSGELTPYFSRIDITQFSAPIENLGWAPGVEDPAGFDPDYVALPGLVTSECVEDGDFTYLSLHINPDPGPRTDDVGGDLSPDWGMHIIDVNVAMGNLVEIVKKQGNAWWDAH